MGIFLNTGFKGFKEQDPRIPGFEGSSEIIAP
jgi:hypothetical protein